MTEIAEHFYISPHYLSRVFKEVTGLPLTEFVNMTRIREAQRLLRQTDAKIIDIAEQVGYGNLSHFGRVFKQQTGLSPLQYRKMR